MAGLSNKDAEKIARKLIELQQSGVSADVSSSDDKEPYLGFFRITSSRLAYWVMKHIRRGLVVMGLLLGAYFLATLFGGWVYLYMLVGMLVSFVIGYFLIRSKEVTVINTVSNPDKPDKFELWAFPFHVFYNQWNKIGELNPIETTKGTAYVVESLDWLKHEMIMSWRHRNVEFWLHKDAFATVKKSAMTNSYELGKLQLKTQVTSLTMAQAYVRRAMDIVSKKLFPKAYQSGADVVAQRKPIVTLVDNPDNDVDAQDSPYVTFVDNGQGFQRKVVK